MSAASKTFIGISEQGSKLCSAAVGELYQHTERAANQPIHQLLAPKAFLTSCAHQGLTSKMLVLFLEGRERRDIMVSLTVTNENQENETYKEMAAHSFAVCYKTKPVRRL